MCSIISLNLVELKMGSPYRINRVRELLLRELSDIVSQLKDPRVHFVTVGDTEVSKDMKYAKMFVSLMGSKEEQAEAQKALKKALGYIRREVAKRVSFRHTPEIRVAYDDTAERAAQITTLINEVKTRDGRA